VFLEVDGTSSVFVNGRAVGGSDKRRLLLVSAAAGEVR